MEAQLEVLSYQILTSNENWEQRLDALLKMNDFFQNCNNKDVFTADVWRVLKNPLQNVLKDLRSSLVREGCKTLETLAMVARDEMRPLMREMLPTMIEILGSGNKVIQGFMDERLSKIIRYTKFKQCINEFSDHIKNSRSKLLRECCSSYIFQILGEWPPEYLESVSEQLEQTIKIALEDASVTVRATARRTFFLFHDHWPALGESLLKGMDQKLANQLRKTIHTEKEALLKARTHVRKDSTEVKAAKSIQAVLRGVLTRRQSLSQQTEEYVKKQNCELNFTKMTISKAEHKATPPSTVAKKAKESASCSQNQKASSQGKTAGTGPRNRSASLPGKLAAPSVQKQDAAVSKNEAVHSKEQPSSTLSKNQYASFPAKPGVPKSLKHGPTDSKSQVVHSKLKPTRTSSRNRSASCSDKAAGQKSEPETVYDRKVTKVCSSHNPVDSCPTKPAPCFQKPPASARKSQVSAHPGKSVAPQTQAASNLKESKQLDDYLDKQDMTGYKGYLQDNFGVEKLSDLTALSPSSWRRIAYHIKSQTKTNHSFQLKTALETLANCEQSKDNTETASADTIEDFLKGIKLESYQNYFRDEFGVEMVSDFEGIEERSWGVIKSVIKEGRLFRLKTALKKIGVFIRDTSKAQDQHQPVTTSLISTNGIDKVSPTILPNPVQELHSEFQQETINIEGEEKEADTHNEQEQTNLNMYQLVLVLRVQAKVRNFLARKHFIKEIYKQAAYGQILRFDTSVRHLIYRNQWQLRSLYDHYTKDQPILKAIDRAGAFRFAETCHFFEKGLCTKQQFSIIVDEITTRDKNFKPGGTVLLSFGQFLEMLILTAVRHVQNCHVDNDEAVYKLDALLNIIDHHFLPYNTVKKQYFPTQFRNIDFSKVKQDKFKKVTSSKLAPRSKSNL